MPFFFEAICRHYDDDVWAGYHESNAAFRRERTRGKPGSYYPPAPVTPPAAVPPAVTPPAA